MDFSSWRFHHALGRLRRLGLGPITHHGPMRWYNPTLADFEWREVPTTDEQALEALQGSAHPPAYAETYREWRALGASMTAALIRAGEAAKEQSERQQREGVDDARPRRG